MKKNKYFEWFDSTGFNERNPWQLGDYSFDRFTWSDFFKGKTIEHWNSDYSAEFEQDGLREDLAISAYKIPIVSDRLKAVLESVAPAEVQFLPLQIYHKHTRENVKGYYIGNILYSIECLDKKNSTYLEWKEEDGQPEKTGSIRSLLKAVLIPTAIGERKIFRLKEWELTVIIREDVKRAIEKSGLLGGRFTKIDISDSTPDKGEEHVQVKNEGQAQTTNTAMKAQKRIGDSSPKELRCNDSSELFLKLSSPDYDTAEKKEMMALFFGVSLKSLIEKYIKSIAGNLKTWLGRLIAAEPPQATITAFLFGLFEETDGFQLYLSGSGHFDELDSDWACNTDYWPASRYANIKTLLIMRKTMEEKNIEMWEFCQALVIIVLMDYLEHHGEQFDMMTGIPDARITTGFDDGDLFILR